MLPIDLTTDERCHDYLAIHMEAQKVQPRESTTLSNRQSSGSKNPLKRLSGFFKKKKGIEDPDSDFFTKMDELRRECQTIEGGRKTITIRNTDQNKKISMADFQIVDKLGSGSFGAVYLITPKKQPSVKYALKILEKEKVIKQNLARYALTERNVLSTAGTHPLVVGLDFAF